MSYTNWSTPELKRKLEKVQQERNWLRQEVDENQNGEWELEQIDQDHELMEVENTIWDELDERNDVRFGAVYDRTYYGNIDTNDMYSGKED